MPPLFLQTLGSLLAILFLAGLAALMKLGGTPRLETAADVQRTAGEVVDGFEAVETALARDGAGALACDAEGRVMLIKRHGNRFAGRILTDRARTRLDGDALEVDCGERRFGRVRLALDEPASWQARIDAIDDR
ncbi:MAG: hypothetical protein G9473_14060 [Erythrobacter sp.]|nr:MAG: hypothetical protein G9473_14060 [Erythrobacter sp.]